MSTVLQTPETTQPAARWEDFIDVYFSPAQLFRRRANDGWGVPFIVLCVAAMVFYFAFLPVTRAITEAAMASQEGMTPEQRSQAMGMAGMFAVIGGILVPIFMLIFTLVGGFLTFIASKLASIEMGFRRALMIVTFIGFLTLIQQLIGYVLMSFKLRAGLDIDPIKDMSFGVLRLMDTEALNPGMIALLSRLDLFAFWQFAWTAIALMAASRAPRGAAIAAAAFVWLTGALPILLQALGNR